MRVEGQSPLKCKIMASGDIQENAMGGGTPKRLRGLAANGDSISPTLEEVMNAMGVFRERFDILAGGQAELPFDSGLIIVQDLSQNHDKAVAILFANGSGKIIVSANTISFFSDVEDKICVINTGDNTKYIIKNRKAIGRAVVVTFIK